MQTGSRASWSIFNEQFAACANMAFANLMQHRLRLAAAVTGVAVALFLLLLQIAILDAARAKVTELFDDFRFDMAIVPDTYQFLLSFDSMDRAVLDVARATGDVADVYGLNVDVVPWAQLPSMLKSYNFLIGLDDPGGFLRDPVIRAGLKSLPPSHSILIDAYSQPSIGPTAIGTAANINGERVEISGQYRLGLFFYADGSAIARNSEFARLSGRLPGTISIGLLQLNPGVDPGRAKADLVRALPSHTLVLTRDELRREERAYFLSIKPIGIMIYISMLIA
jgi:putative ABC transport system permease protein